MSDEKKNAKKVSHTFKKGKIGIIGGKGVGKSYLFQAMVYRTYSPDHAGALSYFIKKGKISLASAPLEQYDNPEKVILSDFIDDYQAWRILAGTTKDSQMWYWLKLPYSTGIFGMSRSELEIEFLDGSGDFLSVPLTSNSVNRSVWEAYQDAQVMIFCLPMWVAFPDPDYFEKNLSQGKDDAIEWRDDLSGFEGIVNNYLELIKDKSQTERKKIKCILALTMADDRKSALKNLRSKWITPYMDDKNRYLSTLREKGSMIMRYLENARKVSDLLHKEFSNSKDPRCSVIPKQLENINGKQPWIIPLSAIDSTMINASSTEKSDKFPVPVHVELPLLVALCEQTNALM